MKNISIILFIISFFCSINAELPSIQRHTCPRDKGEANIVYYFSTPSSQPKSYPIVILCEGSSMQGDLSSVMVMHKYFGADIDALHCGLLTVEKWGINGDLIDEKTLWKQYTRTQRFHDHLNVIKHLEQNPPTGWNKKLIFLGISEGGPLANQLSVVYDNTLATINLARTGDWNWADELWEFLVWMKKDHWFLAWLYNLLPTCLQWYGSYPQNREDYNIIIEAIRKDPSPDKHFMGMTYLYHADALEQKPLDYTKIYAPLLVVVGALDSIIHSCDASIKKAQHANAPVTYFRIDDMDHWVSKRPDIIQKSLDWLKQQLKAT